MWVLAIPHVGANRENLLIFLRFKEREREREREREKERGREGT